MLWQPSDSLRGGGKNGIDTYTIGDFVVTGERYGEELPGGTS